MRIQLDRPGTTVDAVEARLERAIMNGFFAASSALPGEARLARELSVSRPTLRNALSRLVSRGLVEASQGRQTRVSALGRFVSLDAVVQTVLASPIEQESLKLLTGLLKMRRQLYATLLALACEMSKSSEACVKECLNAAYDTRWKKDSLLAIRLELNLLAKAADAANNEAFLYVFGPLHRLFERLPGAFTEARAPDAIERRLLRTADLIQSGSIQLLHRYVLEALEAEDLASMTALSTSLPPSPSGRGSG